MTALPLLLFVLAPAKVTFEHEAAPVDKVLGALSKQTGLDLAVGQTPMLDVVFIKVKDADLDELQKKIAEVTSAKWIEVEGKKRLVPDSNRRQMEERFDEAEYRALLDKSLSRFATMLASTPGSASSRSLFGDLGFVGGASSDRLSMQCALGIGKSALQTVSRDGRVVWSTSPTRGQLALNVPGLAEAVAAAVKDHNDSVDRMMAQDFDNPEIGEELRRMQQTLGPLFGPKKAEGKPALVHVVCTRGTRAYDRNLELETRVYSEAGKLMVSSSTTLASRWEEDMSEGMDKAEPSEVVEEVQAPPEEAPAELPMWEFSEGALEWQRLVRNGGWNRTKDPRTRELILEIATHDPLSYGTSEALSHYAEKVDRDIVANIPDSAAHILDEAANVAAVEASWANDQPLKMAEANGWVILSSRSPSVDRATQIDRVALARLLATADSEGMVRLDQWSDFAVGNPNPRDNMLLGGLVRLMTSSSESMFDEEDRWLVLRLYGTLSDAQRKGAVIPAGIWSQTQRLTAAKWVYGPDPGLVEQVELRFIDRVMQEIPFGGASGQSSLSLEPTQVAPGGLGSNTALVVSRTEDKCYAAVGVGEGGFPGLVGHEEMALLQALMADDASRQTIEREQPLPRQFRVGTRQRIHLSIQVGLKAYVVAELYDDKIDPNSEAMALDSFPDTDRTRIAELADQIKKSPIGQFIKAMAAMGGAFGSGEVIPPSP